ncbi:MAG: hypothetical protein WCO51_13055 [bacterium]
MCRPSVRFESDLSTKVQENPLWRERTLHCRARIDNDLDTFRRMLPDVDEYSGGTVRNRDSSPISLGRNLLRDGIISAQFPAKRFFYHPSCARARFRGAGGNSIILESALRKEVFLTRYRV